MATAAPRSTAAKTKTRAAATTKTLDAIKLLKTDHDEAEALFEQFAKSRSPDKKKQIADKVCMALTVHTMIEEEIFYPACKGEVEDDLLDEAEVEHNGAKQLIAEIEAGNPQDELWEAKVTVLSEYIKHHVKEEEQPGGMFAQARKGDLDLKALGVAMAARKEELMAQMKAARPN
jgi:hemerythrin superfamily protein